MLGNETRTREWSSAEPMPSSRAVSVVSGTSVSYATPTLSDRRRYAVAALLLGTVALAVSLAPHVFGFNGWTVATAGLTAVVLGGVAMHHAPWLGFFGRVAATLGMTMGLAAGTLMLLPFI
jgi:hypothetical protein